MRTRPGRRETAPAPSKTGDETRRIMDKLAAQHPNADTELNFTTPYELLVATILSAQCTDERVNQVTPALFRRYPHAGALARATTDELEPQIQSTGFFRAKSRSLVGMAQAVVEQHGGEIPKSMEELVSLPGVGRKTANVVLGHALGVPGLPVDRHVLRVANRIGIAKSDDPEIVEQQLCAALSPTRWIVTSDTLILHGRRICKPRPLCDRCVVRQECDYYRALMGAVPKGRRPQTPSSSPQLARAAAVNPGRTSKQPANTDPQLRPVRGAKPLFKATRPAKPRTSAGGPGIATRTPESKSVLKSPRAAEPRRPGGAHGVPTGRGESGSPVEKPRAAEPRRPGGAHGVPTGRGESGSPIEKPRAAKPRGTGGGGGAPPRIKE